MRNRLQSGVGTAQAALVPGVVSEAMETLEKESIQGRTFQGVQRAYERILSTCKRSLFSVAGILA